MLKEVFPIDREIQGLLPRKDPYATYWLLLAKVELGKFQDHKEKGQIKK